MSEIKYLLANKSDMPEIKALLSKCNLPVEDITTDLLKNFMVAMDGEQIVGVAGFEACGETALLRSLAVEPDCRGKGVGKALVELIEASADFGGLRSLYLLTETAEGYFKGLGFLKVTRDSLPDSVKETAEFKTLCPQSAICMKLY
jgi:amino-acid N-acetyltransferase